MGKVVFIMVDALGYQAGVEGMGYMMHLVESGQAALYKVKGELPSLSRPIYETLHTGLPVSVHGILSNATIRLSNQPNLFQLARQAGKTTAAAAYWWVSELYNRAPFDVIMDREVDDENLIIQHGRFYIYDDYPDRELFYDAGLLVRRFHPDFLLIHPMGMDYAGHTKGANTPEYRNQAIFIDAWLTPLYDEWLKLGYTLLVTGDHGMNADRAHGGDTEAMRMVPLFIAGQGIQTRGDTGETISQLSIAPTICRMLGLPIPATMKAPPLI